MQRIGHPPSTAFGRIEAHRIVPASERGTRLLVADIAIMRHIVVIRMLSAHRQFGPCGVALYLPATEGLQDSHRGGKFAIAAARCHTSHHSQSYAQPQYIQIKLEHHNHEII